MEELKARQKKELKEMQAKIMQLKKSIGGNKKRKKEVQEEIKAMEAEIKERHQKEIDEFNKNNTSTENTDNINNNSMETDEKPANPEETIKNAIESNTFPIQQKQKKPNRQKLRKERKAAKLREEQRLAEEEAKNMVNTKQVEDDAFKKKLKDLGLEIHEIIADGHCLYNSIAHQLSLVGETYDYKDLRRIAADWMRNHYDDFFPFLLNSNGELYSEEEYQRYCDDVEFTALWGGQLETQAISQALEHPITIIQAESAPIEIGNDFPNEKLYISYHLHSFGLGEHYNSLVKIN
ncbi:cysteine proteinase [Anaeromyces robustus]|uniref:Cysteine proteinase n=1 Tax=Anaeromyces robustus TaxID=1754192 RepID=A0A1Y1XKL5_9FUNG|nr:cysteine proteinase [Anaeromyces robustus]|eukprot:ORX86252.1 cysteine proteinase [Anaeromyces robustus]